MEYQLPRLTRMWTHLERQAGGMVKGMGEKQIEVDKRILRDRVCDDHKINIICIKFGALVLNGSCIGFSASFPLFL